MKKNIKKGLYFSLLLLIVSFSSCLKHDLPSYPLWDGNQITNVFVEYRYNTDEMYNGKPVVADKRLEVSKVIDTVKNIITLDITVPPASGNFTQAIRDQVSQTKLWPYFDISTAATMNSAEGTPKPGFSTDFTKPQTYIVTAANGDKRTWTVKVSSFTK